MNFLIVEKVDGKKYFFSIKDFKCVKTEDEKNATIFQQDQFISTFFNDEKYYLTSKDEFVLEPKSKKGLLFISNLQEGNVNLSLKKFCNSFSSSIPYHEYLDRLIEVKIIENHKGGDVQKTIDFENQIICGQNNYGICLNEDENCIKHVDGTFSCQKIYETDRDVKKISFFAILIFSIALLIILIILFLLAYNGLIKK